MAEIKVLGVYKESAMPEYAVHFQRDGVDLGWFLFAVDELDAYNQIMKEEDRHGYIRGWPWGPDDTKNYAGEEA